MLNLSETVGQAIDKGDITINRMNKKDYNTGFASGTKYGEKTGIEIGEQKFINSLKGLTTLQIIGILKKRGVEFFGLEIYGVKI